MEKQKHNVFLTLVFFYGHQTCDYEGFGVAIACHKWIMNCIDEEEKNGKKNSSMGWMLIIQINCKN